MKQVVQSYRTGQITLEEVPVPVCRPGVVLVQTARTLISIGTERSVIEMGRRSLLGKAASRPDLVKRALAKAGREGYWKTFQEALGRLDTPTPLGYSASGTVLAVGAGVEEFGVGDRVACMGAGFASHAEFLAIPLNLCVRLPHAVSFDDAAFGMLGTIAMHGVRLGNVSLGSRVGVIGLGLLGLLTVQLLKASGCEVLAYDLDPAKAERARRFGADLAVSGEAAEVMDHSAAFGYGHGLDTVIVTASSKDSRPLELAADVCRFRGKIVLVGVAHIEIPRQILWEKEIEFQVSKASGPGALDPSYELGGVDYPLGYVRWTERRNLEAFLELIAQRRLDVQALITHRYPIAQALHAYDMLMSPGSGGAIGVMLEYIDRPEASRTVVTQRVNPKLGAGDQPVRVGVIGAGLFAKALLLPALAKANGIQLAGIAAASGVTVNHVQHKFGFEYGSTDYHALLDDKTIDAVVILTRHRLHAQMVTEALEAGKHVFVEKPLCVNEAELVRITETYDRMDGGRVLMVGYNRRFAPLAVQLKSYLMPRRGPLIMTCRVNPGALSSEHWVNDPQEGGGRIIGELCHFIDLCQFFCDAAPLNVYAGAISGASGHATSHENVGVNLQFRDGSIADVVYTASGDRAYSRERIEIFSAGTAGVIEDFRRVEFVAQGKTKSVRRWNQDLGYSQELDAFISAVRTGSSDPLPFEQACASSLVTFRILDSLATGNRVEIGAARDRAAAESDGGARL